MPANGQAAASNFLTNWLAAPTGPVNNDIFSSQNLDQQGNVINAVNQNPPTTNTKPNAAENKTPNKSSPTLVRAKEKNVLSTLRSYTYNFTMACLSKAQASNPNLYNKSDTPLQRIILQSSGKKTSAMTSTAEPTPANPYPDQVSRASDRIKDATAAVNNTLITDFNQYSSGRFNLFIENVEIDTTMAFTKQSNTALPTTFKFDVIEPYSVNGFLEALAVSAAAAGWSTYSQAVFVLLVEFQGYPDTDQGPSDKPVVLPEKRYFPFRFSGMDIEITERGTKYVCSGFPNNEEGYGTTVGQLISNTTAKGGTVGDLLRDLVSSINNQLTEEREPRYGKGTAKSKQHHEYYVRFDGWTPQSGFVKGAGNEIEKADVLDPDKHAQNFTFPNPSSVPAGKDNYRTIQYDEMGNVISSSSTPETSQTQHQANNAAVNSLTFNSGLNLYEIMSDVVVNSEYVRGIMKDLFTNKGATSFVDQKSGMIKYFAVRIESEENGRDDDNNIDLKKYTYVISPYQIHFTRIPGFSKIGINQADLETRSVRSYNYIYTGENQEILNFRLQYNYLFFEGMPVSYGANDKPTQENRSAPDGGTEVTVTGSSVNPTLNAVTPNIQPTATINTDPKSTSNNKNLDGIVRQDDPYFALANNLHQHLIDPKASMALAEMDILGDPYFLVTNSMGNQIDPPDPTKIQTTVGGQNDHLTGDCVIDIKFKNPDDIDSNPKSAGYGFMSYNQRLNQPFQGAYRVTRVQSYFKEGLFKQHLELVRVAGQDPQNKNTGSILSNSDYAGTSNPSGQVSQDTRNTTDASLAPAGASLLNVAGRGTPTQNSNFTNASGGFGILPPGQSFGGVTNGIGKLTAAAAVFGSSIPGGVNQSSPIRINVSSIDGSLASVNNTVASAQATVNAVQNFNPNSLLPSYITDPGAQLSGLFGGSVLGKAYQQLKDTESTVAANINLSQSVKDGVSFKYVSNFANVPPSQGTAKVVTEFPDLTADEQTIVAKGGLAALAEARGVAVSELPTNVVNEANTVISQKQSAAQEIKNIIGNANAIINQGKVLVSSVSPVVNIISKSG